MSLVGGLALVVEDEAIVALDLSMKLEELGFQVCGSVPSGEAALETLGEIVPDLIFMDIRLQGDLDGIETVQRIREKHDLPVIYTTAYSDAKTRKRAASTNPVAFLNKPVSFPSLQKALDLAAREMLRRPRAS